MKKPWDVLIALKDLFFTVVVGAIVFCGMLFFFLLILVAEIVMYPFRPSKD